MSFVELVTDLLSVPDAERDIDVKGPLPLRFDHAASIGDAQAHVRLRRVGDDLLASGSASIDVTFTCTRCLIERSGDVVAEFAEVFSREPSESTYPIDERSSIDLEPLLRNELALALPLRPLCKAGCKGLCPTCGSDLNVDPCSGHDEELESPFSALRQLFGD